jgi:hypothetical protein
VPDRVFRDPVERASDQVPEGVTAKYISAQQHNIHNQNKAADTYSEAVRKTEGHHCVVG